MRIKNAIILCFLLLCGQNLCAQEDSIRVHYPNRLLGIGIATGAAYAGSIGGLYYLWYADYPQTHFHFFNDFDEWNGMDKIGHATTTYYIGFLGSQTLQWGGLNRQKSVLWSTATSFAYLTTIEILDGFSSGWGFSLADMSANALGLSLFYSQELLWKEQRIQPKVSFSPSPYASMRPDLLGSNYLQQSLKDYNGQTYWLSANISSFLPSESRFPKWLNIALGYGAEGMITASESNTITIPYYSIDRYSQLYLAPDIDLSKIKVKSKLLGTAFKALSFIKFPAPAIEFRQGKFSGHWLFF